MNETLLILALIVAAADWVAVAKQWKALEFVAKPGVMVVLLIWLWSVSGFAGPLLWFALGLGFSMLGDIFLMLPREQFIAGLIAFLLAHVAYLIGFNLAPPPVGFVGIVLAAVVALTGVQLYRQIARGLERGGHPELKLPVLVYSTVISLMVLSALLTLVRDDWQPWPALTASAGALLFFISDSLLAWNKFVHPLPNGRLMVIIAYHLGQALIVYGAAMHFV